MEGTWLARTPISPDSAGILTWTLLFIPSRVVSDSVSYGRWAKRADQGRNLHIRRFIDSLMKPHSVCTKQPLWRDSMPYCPLFTYLVRKDKWELEFICHGVGITSSLRWNAECGRACSYSSPGKPKRAHCASGMKRSSNESISCQKRSDVESSILPSRVSQKPLGRSRFGSRDLLVPMKGNINPWTCFTVYKISVIT